MRFEDVEIQGADDDDNQKRALYNVSLLVTYANAAVDDKSDYDINFIVADDCQYLSLFGSSHLVINQNHIHSYYCQPIIILLN